MAFLPDGGRTGPDDHRDRRSRSDYRDTDARGDRIADLPAKIQRRIRIQGDCWVWFGSLQTNGYGQIEFGIIDGKRVVALAHRHVWLCLIGTEPEQLHHLCGNKPCVNPDHLEPTNASEHHHFHPPSTHCKYGHLYDEANTYQPARGGRQCRICRAERQRARYAANPSQERERVKLYWRRKRLLASVE